MSHVKVWRVILAALSVTFLAVAVSAAEIHVAAQLGDLGRVRELLEGDPSLLEEKDEAGSTPLIVACSGGQMEVARYLIGIGADINAGDNEDSRAIHLAGVSGNTELIGYLLDLGMEVDTRDENGMTALLFAGYRGQKKAVEYLISRGADIGAATNGGGTLMHAASYSGNMELLEMLLANGANADLPPDQYGNTPLAAAAARCREEVVRLLIEEGAPIEPAYGGANSPMLAAAWLGCNSVIEMLIGSGGRVDVVDEGGGIPLDVAAIAGHGETVKLLVDNGADVNHRAGNGKTPLLWASHSGNTEIVEFLLSKGALQNIADDEGTTPLIEAAQEGHAESVALLLAAGADVDARQPQKGWTALHFAATCGYGDIAEMLIEAGAEVDVKDNGGMTPVYYASLYGNRSAAGCLEAHKCKSVKCENNFGSCKQLTTNMKEGEAYVWYLGHSGWAVRTKSSLMVFDCSETGRKPDEPCISNGYIVPREVAGLNVTVFASHAHADHYSKHILGWRGAIDGIDYVMGFPCDDLDDYILALPGKTLEHEGMKISTIESNDSGVGFLVEVDGVRLFHAGDHANRKRDFSGPYTGEINRLANDSGNIDLAFLPVTGCGFGDQEAVKLGVFYALKKLEPAFFFPMHGGKRSARYAEYEKEAREMGFKSRTVCAEGPGARFHFARDEDGTFVLSMRE